MKIKLYNTPARKIEEFKPLKRGQVGIYSCGPTVYWNQHLGHMYAYTHWDVLAKLFGYLNFKIKSVMNVTDVGHLTSDEDFGEDKMEKGARREGLTVWQIADKYLAQFLESLDLLNIRRPEVLCRATKHIQEQIALIKKIEANGFTYRTKTGLVFDTSKFPDYSKFAGLKLGKQAAGARVKIDLEKKKPWDFLLWVTNQPKHVMLWDSPWGRGFPGWHVECTAMSTKYLGKRFDIHTGGQEHISVHHTNEVAQGFGAFGKQTANYWLHNAWLTLKGGRKMSKSKGNFYTVQDLIEKGFDPLAFRYLVLTSHYRQGLVFDWEALRSAQSALFKLRRAISPFGARVKKEKSRRGEFWKKKFLEALAYDLGSPQALAVLWRMMKSSLKLEEKKNLLLDFDQILGLRLGKAESPNDYNIPVKVKELAGKREEWRKKGDFRKADLLREKIHRRGYLIKDLAGGYQLEKVDG